MEFLKRATVGEENTCHHFHQHPLPYFAKIKIYLLQDGDAAAGDDNCHHAGNNMTLVIMMLYT